MAPEATHSRLQHGPVRPPDVEGTTSANKLHKKHALGSRASKLASHGILTVRFEMPFPVWCASCPKPTIIAQGVRFNAEKKKVGAYYSTPVWSFRFTHADCGGAIEMRTDPKNTAYVVVEGAAKRDLGEDRVRPGDHVIMTDEEREALRSNAFAKLEKTIEDREQLRAATDRIHELMDASSRHWDDPYTQNQRLRKAFRAGRKEREREEAAAEHLKDRLGVGIDLLPESEDDARRAALVDFGPVEEDTGDRALAKPLFKTTSKPRSDAPLKKVDKRAVQIKNDFTSEVLSNTRMSRDPFLNDRPEPKQPARIPGVKRKRAEDAEGGPPKAKPHEVIQDAAPSSGLVSYDSD
ncbi:CWC16 protein [Stachybotrys elegans]|uniref:CWC16 protein n=1 Tax=Stachybotrys elegans TaxID=80388 RepID=A0A8K0SJN2_9HYPO|nr:CWC16 protein [Stachybotrys elegans]